MTTEIRIVGPVLCIEKDVGTNAVEGVRISNDMVIEAALPLKFSTPCRTTHRGHDCLVRTITASEATFGEIREKYPLSP